MLKLEIINSMQKHIIDNLYFEEAQEAQSANDLINAMERRIKIEKPKLTSLEDYFRGMPSFLATGYDYEEAAALGFNNTDDYWKALAEAASFLMGINALLKHGN